MAIAVFKIAKFMDVNDVTHEIKTIFCVLCLVSKWRRMYHVSISQTVSSKPFILKVIDV